jgi:DNA (cytosine-5)-methyltransferase 1
METLTDGPFLAGFDVIHASPPCQAYSVLRHRVARPAPMLIDPVRERLKAWGGTYVIENVPGAPLDYPLILCGASLGLGVDGSMLKRHRLFESNAYLMGPPCACGSKILGVYGTSGSGPMTRGIKASRTQGGDLMGIDWMTWRELTQAIPPVYTELIGEQLVDLLTTSPSPSSGSGSPASPPGSPSESTTPGSPQPAPG